MKIHAEMFAALVVAAGIAYAGAFNAPLVSDDVNAIISNEHVVGELNLPEIFTTYSWWGADRADSPGYRPLTTLTYAVQHWVSGSAPGPFHATNIVLHALVGQLLWLLALALGVDRLGAAAAALAFVAMPIHSEAVIWSVGRAEILAALGFAGAALALLRARMSPMALTAAAFCLFAGILAKENAVTILVAPALFAIFVHRNQPAPASRAAKETAALGIGLLAYVGLRAAADGPFLPATTAADILDNPLHGLDLPGRAAGALAVLGRYIGLVVWPLPLSIDYSYNALGIAEGFRGNLWSVIGFATCGGSLWSAWRWRQLAAVPVGLGLAVASYSIVSNSIVQIGTIMGERLFYLPTLGLCLAAAPALSFALNRDRKRAGVVLGAVALAWIAIDIDRTRDWRSHIELFQQTTEAVPHSARAHMELASALGRAGRTEEALASFRSALAIKPDYGVAAYNMGNMLAKAGKLDEARRAFRTALSSRPDFDRAWNNLVVTHEIAGDRESALAVRAESITTNPSHIGLRIAYAMDLAGYGRLDRAEQEFDTVLESSPNVPEALYGRGMVRERSQGCSAALDDYRRAARLLDEPVIQAAVARCEAQVPGSTP
ncbi:MAG: tetratricopeptide (TPR) repeat protein [Candidatus Binatia bacterium]